jgi:hypothetical protein
VGTVAGSGTTTQKTSYSFLDKAVGSRGGVVYYRLKQIDLDGTGTFSPVRTVSFSKAVEAGVLGVFPNPATASTQLDLSQLPTGRYQVSVLDATGRTVLGLTLEAGLAHGLELKTLASGTYTVLVRGQNVSLTKRLIKE